ncbi:amino acid transporter [Emericellopsis cladophorae]|uniref:Amino acid transporter n=1 Tax=Emericellopsis cladophorae TaxID=2686198 RepID=A0A9P9Y495_9HYPO|nr:amino acid transporter [Emericellopsis cladophorae]KAI6782913.1 amino acid transporter [Emericellopsis cladophorae]
MLLQQLAVAAPRPETTLPCACRTAKRAHVPDPHENNSAVEICTDDPAGNEGLQRKLNARHLTFISLGSVIVTSIFLGVGNALVTAGPMGLVLSYPVICSVVYCVMLCVGEMVTYLPVAGARMRLSARFVDPSLSAAMSWNYWYCWALIAAAGASAVAVLMTYWTDAVNSGVWIAICLAVTLGVNLCGPRVYAEVECCMSSVKVTTILGLIILSIAVDAGAGSDGDVIGFCYWTDPGPFVQYSDVPSRLVQFPGIFSGLKTAADGCVGVFIFLVKLTALSGFITWECIAVTYLRFRADMKAQQVPKSVLPWKSGFSTIGAWGIIIVISSVLLFSGWLMFKEGNWSTAEFFGNYLPLMMFVAVYGGFKVGTRSRFVRTSELDLTTGLEEIERKTAQCKEEDKAEKATKPGVESRLPEEARGLASSLQRRAALQPKFAASVRGRPASGWTDWSQSVAAPGHQSVTNDLVTTTKGE